MLKTVVETLDGLDEAVTKFYAEKDGKFYLQIEGVNEHPDVVSLKNAYERVKADKATAIEERDAFKAKAQGLPEDFDAEKWAKLKDGKPDEAALVRLRQELEVERDEWKSKFETAQETARKNALDRDLSDALTAAGVTEPAYMKAARTMLSAGVQVGDDGKPYVETDMGPMALADHVKRWAAGEGKPFVAQPSGGGAKGGSGSKSGGDNPWKAETRNLTRQAEILKTDPAEANRLKQEAGVA